jgi:pyrrolidone-carboxylate peptidase
MGKALVTSSETFGQYLFHPGKWLALKVDKQTVADYEITSLVFPTTCLLSPNVEDPGTTIVKKAKVIGADVILSFGMASEVKGFRIERSGYNWIENLKYCLPDENFHALDDSRPTKEQLKIDISKWDWPRIRKSFKEKNMPLEPAVSDDPGRFTCNAWIYRTLVAMKKYKLNIPYLFVHTACTTEAIELMPDFPRDKKMVIAKEELLSALEIFLGSYRHET